MIARVLEDVTAEINGYLGSRYTLPLPSVPLAVPQWSEIAPDLTLTDTSHNLSCRESFRARERINRVVVRGYLPGGGHLSARLDDREHGLNRGRSTFPAGGAAHLLVQHDPRTAITNLTSSAGSLHTNPDQTWQITEEIAFISTATAQLAQPAISIDSVIWLGNDLGGLTLAPDGTTVMASTAGVAIARVMVTVRATSWQLLAPDRLAGLDEFPVLVRVSGTTSDAAGDGEITCQRGDGAHSGADISEPLLSHTLAKLSRGRAEIDAGEDLQEISLSSIFQPDAQPGRIAEIHDALMGRAWRGKITSVSHQIAGPRATTAMELRRVFSPA
ncbi:MAG: DUF1320 family protein [Magnetococcales bacterium]|nr:DUF1320 family protein [Magnetococcales bacterium]